ncbi:MAG: hypothetical protein HAW59_03490 [Betaproteobacteria bacterium]|nr:hypothetical protein [Betaproteobacteria bacterium]
MAQTPAIILLTQKRHGEGLLEAAAHYTGETPKSIAAIGLCGNENRGEIQTRLQTAVDGFAGRNILILCDLFGSTHATIAAEVARANRKVCLVCGLNLAMLLETQTTLGLSVKKAAAKAAKAGKRAVIGGAEKR